MAQKDNKTYRAVEQDDGSCVLHRFVDGKEVCCQPDGKQKPYTIDAAGCCNCPGWTYNKTCRHVSLVKAKGGAVPRSKAVNIARQVCNKLEPFVSKLNTDDLETDSEGLVVKICMSGKSNAPGKVEKVLRAVVDGVKVEVRLK